MQLLGVRIDNISMPEVLQRIEEFLSDGRQHQVVLLYSEFFVLAQKDVELRDILSNADLSICDGMGPVFLSRLFSQSLRGRITGVDLIVAVAGKFGGGHSFFLFGGAEGVAQKTVEVIKIKSGQVYIAGCLNGYVENSVALEEINKTQPEVLLVALGAPKQEKWISQNLAKLPSVKVAIGVGGAFDLISGRLKRAPVFMQKTGLEWLWRLILEPKRLPRIINAIIKFPWLVLKAKLF